MALAQPEPACLLIADISGYTGYLAGVELDHAQDIIADLIDTMVGALRPPFHLSKLEGDAAFVYLAASEIDGLHLQNVVESAYFAFRRHQRDIAQASICQCDACHQIPNLDLKFVVHCGQVARQQMSGQEELVGRDVILIHRLLKNEVRTKLGNHAYALYTDAFVKAGGIDPAAQKLVPHTETIDIIGEVGTWLCDLSNAWREEEQRRRVRITADSAHFSLSHDFATPRQILWDYLTSPRLRASWSLGTTSAYETSDDGRRGPGTVIHCMHGKDVVLEEIVDWRPPEYLTRRNRLPVPNTPAFLSTHELVELPGEGTRLTAYMEKPPPELKDVFDMIRTGIEEYFAELNKKLVQLVEAEGLRERKAAQSQPIPPVSAERFLTEPVTGLGRLGEGV